MKRFVLNLLTGVSALLCIAAVGLWIRSYWATPGFHWAHDPELLSYYHSREVWVSHGGLGFLVEFGHILMSDRRAIANAPRWVFESQPSAGYPRFSPLAWVDACDDATRGYRFFGFEMKHEVLSVGKRYPDHRGDLIQEQTMVVIPLAAIVILTALLPLRSSLLILRHNRVRSLSARGLCPACGYNLHVTPNRCPECGMVQKQARYSH